MAGDDVGDNPLKQRSDQGRIVEVQKIKEQGNCKFKEGEFFEAKCLYSGALEMLEQCCLHLDKADTLWVDLKNNIALCDFKREEWTRVVDTTTEILTRESTNTKALYRRGVAHMGCGKFQAAQSDLKRVVELEPNNAEARQKLADIAQQNKSQKVAEKDQAKKLGGFLKGERLDDGVVLSEDGGIRKLNCNENSPLLSSWIKREWLTPNSGVFGAVTAHVVMKAQDGKELINSRKPPDNQSPAGASSSALRPVAPCRWIINDPFGAVFEGWNVASKSAELNAVSRFEVSQRTLGPSVEGAIQRCIERWLPDTPARIEISKDATQAEKKLVIRRQAAQMLSLPEGFCLQPPEDPEATLSLELEVLEAVEFTDIHGDGRVLLRILDKGKPRSEAVPVVSDLAMVTAHFRIAKLLTNYSLNDSRMGLKHGDQGMVMREDKTKDPLDFIVGEEDAGGEGEFVPPCIGRCLLMLPGGVVQGMTFELILQEGVPISEMEAALYAQFQDGMPLEAFADNTGPVSVRVEVKRVQTPLQGPSTPGWQGLDSLRQERLRAEELEVLDGDRHKKKALKRWRRIVVWMEQILRGRQWKVHGGPGNSSGSAGAATGSSMYDLEWDEDENTEGEAVAETSVTQSSEGLEGALPELFEPEEELLEQLDPEELEEWASAHAAVARLLKAAGGAASLSYRHARCVVKACAVGCISKETEISGRSTLGSCLLDIGETEEALQVLRAALARDPTNDALKDQCAVATQKDGDAKVLSVRDELKRVKQELVVALEVDAAPRLLELLEEVDEMPLTWEVVTESAIGKEVGRCTKHSDGAVVERAKAIVGKLHRLAKAERPMWVR